MTNIEQSIQAILRGSSLKEAVSNLLEVDFPEKAKPITVSIEKGKTPDAVLEKAGLLPWRYRSVLTLIAKLRIPFFGFYQALLPDIAWKVHSRDEAKRAIARLKQFIEARVGKGESDVILTARQGQMGNADWTLEVNLGRA